MHLEQRRVNITPLAKQFLAEGYQSGQPASDILSSTPQPNSAEAVAHWNALKPELYVLFSIISDRVVQRAYGQREDRPPYGLIEGKQKGHIVTPMVVTGLNKNLPFVDLRTSMSYTLIHAVSEEFEDINRGQVPTEIQAVHNRAQAILDHINTILPGSRPNVTVQSSIAGGIGTATEVMSSVLAVIAMQGQRRKPTELVAAAKNSYPLIGRFAMTNLHIFGQFTVADAFGTPFMPITKYLSLEGEGEKTQLILSQQGQDLFDVLEENFVIGNLVSGTNWNSTTGCPAMVNFNGGSAIRKLWDWHIDIAEQVYQTLA